MENRNQYQFYSKMSLDRTMKITTALLGVGALLVIPFAVGQINYLETGNPWFFLFVVPFIILLAVVWLLSPRAVATKNAKLFIIRPIGPLEIGSLQDIVEVKQFNRQELKKSAGIILRTWGAGGLWGAYGSFWSKSWGFFKTYATRNSNYVLLKLKNGKKYLITPDDIDKFISIIKS